jgi:sterol desaturase/sphingolipid hydroxylase (fatty acid hydroxylase superfamily)
MIAAAAHLIACMLVFTLVERLWPASAPRKWWRRPLVVDIVSWLIVPLAIGAGFTFAVLLLDGLKSSAIMWPWLVWLRTAIARLPLIVNVVVAFVTVDFLAYWLHRAYHRVPFLWSFHVMHHTSDSVDWLSTLRVHPISQMIDTALVTAVLLFAGLPLKALLAANALVGFLGVLTHANVPWTFGPFGRLFVSPVFHHWHHAKVDEHALANFGAALSIWDRIFQTSREVGHQPRQYGMADAPATNFWDLLLHPLRFWLPSRRKR